MFFFSLITLKRCSPVGCSYVPNSACTPNSTVTDASIMSQISGTNCNSTCTASTLSKCTASSMASAFAKGIASNSIKSIWCTDQYMIINSNGMPNHNDSLLYVPRPVRKIFKIHPLVNVLSVAFIRSNKINLSMDLFLMIFTLNYAFRV